MAKRESGSFAWWNGLRVEVIDSGVLGTRVRYSDGVEETCPLVKTSDLYDTEAELHIACAERLERDAETCLRCAREARKKAAEAAARDLAARSVEAGFAGFADEVMKIMGVSDAG